MKRCLEIDSRFNDSQAGWTFSLTLALDDGVEKEPDLSVAELVFFCTILILEQDRQPMQLSLKADVKYASESRLSFIGSKSTKVVSKRYVSFLFFGYLSDLFLLAL